MQRQENKIGTESGGFSMDDSEYRVLRTNISRIVDEGLSKFIDGHRDDDKNLYELVQQIEHKSKRLRLGYGKDKDSVVGTSIKGT